MEAFAATWLNLDLSKVAFHLHGGGVVHRRALPLRGQRAIKPLIVIDPLRNQNDWNLCGKVKQDRLQSIKVGMQDGLKSYYDTPSRYWREQVVHKWPPPR